MVDLQLTRVLEQHSPDAYHPLVDVLSAKSSLLGVAMRRREFITSLASTITAWPFVGLAQTASKVYRIGVLSTNPLPADTSVGAAILRAFARHGYMPDRNLA